MSGWVAAIAAVAAALVVGWQSWETRRSADASKEAAEAAVRGLKVATEALDVARAEERHNRTLIVEAHRARMDAALPVMSVQPRAKPYWPPLISRAPDLLSSWETWEEGRELPGDDDVRVAVGGRVELHNGSNRILELFVEYTPYSRGPTGTENIVGDLTTNRVRLNPGERKVVDFVTWTSLSLWLAGADLTNHGSESRAPAIVSYRDALDSSADVSWYLAMDGSPYERVEGRTDVYTPEPTGLGFRVAHEYRDYWLSRRRVVPLDRPGGD